LQITSEVPSWSRSSLHGSLNPPFHEIPNDFIFSIVLVVFSKYILSFISPCGYQAERRRQDDHRSDGDERHWRSIKVQTESLRLTQRRSYLDSSFPAIEDLVGVLLRGI
jgi:hypothetical protein